MRTRLYQMLVNRQSGISQRYHKVHDGSTGMGRLFSYVYLVWLNAAFYFLFCRWLGNPLSIPVYEEKRLPVDKPENTLIRHIPAEELAEKLLAFDVISFDIFDTLVLRPFSEPADLFYLIGQKLGYMDFKRIRMEAEYRARWKKQDRCKSLEVTLIEIWEELESMTGLDAKSGAELEAETELGLCYANPYLYEVFWRLRRAGKRLVITSDMYLPAAILSRILKSCGYEGYERLFVSCEVQKCKGDGSLFDYVKAGCGAGKDRRIRLAHVGDNKSSDVRRAEERGIVPFWYPNVNSNSLLYRSYDMSPVIGGAYRGLVNNRIYNGLCSYNQNQEYGYIYGGLFAVGYCSFIHEYCREHHVDKILFLARDGEILQKVYQLLYPQEETVYAYLSRLSAAKLTAGYFKYDYIRKLIRHKSGQGFTLSQILEGMELTVLEGMLPSFVPADAKARKGMRPSDKLTCENVDIFIEFINAMWTTILEQYEAQRAAAGMWYRDIVGQAENIIAVDIGWAGSGALALKTLFEREWHINCKLTGLIAGTNTIHNAEPDMSETMLLDGSLVPYLYSSRENRDLWKKHNPARMYNVYFELLTSSASPSFQGFYYDEKGEVELRFLKPEKNPEGIQEIQEGILDFARDYKEHFSRYPYLFTISGRDAYAPLLLAAGYQERYLKHINQKFGLSVGVNR